MRISLAFSPCPNDTFMFHDIASGGLSLSDCRFDVHLHDIETLNRRALSGEYDITKVSFHAWLKVRDEYRLLNSGAALGYGCGPIVVSKKKLGPADIRNCRIAVPGELTTAHLLFRLWALEAVDKVFTTYDRIMPMVLDGSVDCGVVIHEGRFVFREVGLRLIADLGRWWEDTTNLPIPLAGIVARRSLPEATANAFDDLLRQSIANSQADPSAALPYIRQYAQEMASDVLDKHIDTFVNDSSLGLDDDGRAAVEKLETMAKAAGVIE